MRWTALTLKSPLGETLGVMGPSGCGKSTLLHLLGGLERASAGEIELAGQPVSDSTERAPAHLRLTEIGFVFQGFYLMDELTAIENVELPGLLAGRSSRAARARARELLEQVGLADRAGFLLSALSGGQRQRVAIARALINRPMIVLADEPTGNVPAIRAARTSTISALADTPRVPPRRPLLTAVSARLPVTLLLALRQLCRRPRRALLNATSVTLTVTGITAILASRAHTPIASLTISNLKVDRFNELTAVITVMLVILAAVSVTFIAWATAADGRFTSALERALGATAGQVTAGLSMAALLPALPGAIIGIPLGIAVYHLLASGFSLAVPPAWQLAGVVVATLLAVTVLTAIPSRIGARRSPAQALQAE